jgi:integrase/recombinase XerD
MELRQRQASHGEMSHRVIPQEVLAQLKARLDSFPAHIQRMVIILVESGMRVNEVCSLPFDCLLRDEAGNWFLRYPQLKTQQEHTIPLSYRAAAAIREQQQAVKDEQSSTTHLLFPNPNGGAFSQRTFINRLNRIAYERDIRDASGTVWRFQARQFRYTVIAQMINDGVPLHHIQYYWNMQTLDEVMSVYKQVFGPPRKDAFFPLLTTIADGKGKCGELRELFERVRVPWINKNALPPNEPFGCCTLPPTVCLRPHIYPCLVEGCFFQA